MLDTELMTYLGKLSKLQMDAADKQRFAVEMSAIVEIMDTLNDLNLNKEDSQKGVGVPLEHLRVDEPVQSFDREVMLQNASHKKDGFFVVPKIME